MKINSHCKALCLAKNQMISKKDEAKTFYTLVFYIKETEETIKIFVDLDIYNKYEKMKEYEIDLTFIYNSQTSKLSIYLK
jgi:hypothetical protein